MTSTVTITYDSNNPDAMLAIRNIRKIDCLKVSKAVTSKSDREAILDEIRQARKEAEKIMKEKKKGCSKAEILATI